MDPIIKTPRVSPSAFPLDLHHPKPDAKQQPAAPKPKPDGPADLSNEASHFPVHGASILTQTSIERLVPPPTNSELLPSHETRMQQDLEREKKALQEAYSKAHDEGYEAGLKAGKEKAAQEIQAALSQVNALLNSLKDLSESLFQEMEDSAAEVVFQAVCRIIGNAATDKNLVYAITHEAIEQVKARERLTVRVAVKDYEVIKAAVMQTGNEDFLSKEIKLVADNLVQLGGCLVETEAGGLDARLEIQIQRLKEILLGVRKANDDA